MGTTIRRQPVSFNIPDAPNYKFLNITNFGGIEKSSNPFVVSSNTASDCLNVYVDEDNALTTRPRVSPKHDLVKLAELPTSFTLIAIYNLHDGYLLQGLNGVDAVMVRFTIDDDGVMSNRKYTNNVPNKKVVVFEQDDKVYMMGDGKYLVIDNGSLEEVEPYIPTTRIGKNKLVKTIKNDSEGIIQYELDSEGKEYESLNILTDKYKETYFWDGNTPLLNDPSVIDFENEYLSVKNTVPLKFEDGDIPIIPWKHVSSPDADESIGNIFIGFMGDTVYRITIDNDLNLVDYVEIGPVDVLRGIFPVLESSEDGSVVVIGRYVYLWNESTQTYSQQTETIPSGSGTLEKLEHIKVSSDNLVIVALDRPGRFFVGMRQDATAPFTFKRIDDYMAHDGFDLVGSKGIVTIGYSTQTTKSKCTLNYIDLSTSSYAISVLFDFLNDERYLNNTVVNVSDIDKSIMFCYASSLRGDTGVLYYSSDYSDSSKYVILDRGAPWAHMPNFIRTTDSDKIYYVASNGDATSGWIFPNKTKNQVIYFNSPKLAELTVSGWFMPYYVTDNMWRMWYINFTDETIEHSDIYFSFDSIDPLLSVTRQIDKNHKDYEKIQHLRSVLKTVSFACRFDNNLWFAADATTFHTQHNNPSYVPYISYNDLGENYQHITGLSIINDNVLAAYKRNKIYIITPVTVGDRLTYSYTETKNVIGNDAVGAPILTILTEMPTIVSYDGIYALNQLENVQSGDRITTLISEAINPLWLKESKNDIDRCLTMNRLYWTYYILPHKRQSGEKEDCTKVYLLDNRTQQWYYWKLPLFCINAFIKENKTHLVDDFGQIFTLETSDLTSANLNETEYYDKLSGGEKRLIPWHWASQILSLNTINYSKRLVDTTFILTDTDTQDGYSLDYNFKAWRKTVSETNQATLGGDVHYVQSMTKRTRIPRFSFIQFKLENTKNDVQNNKLRLVGLGLKYVLLEGLY